MAGCKRYLIKGKPKAGSKGHIYDGLNPCIDVGADGYPLAGPRKGAMGQGLDGKTHEKSTETVSAKGSADTTSTKETTSKGPAKEATDETPAKKNTKSQGTLNNNPDEPSDSSDSDHDIGDDSEDISDDDASTDEDDNASDDEAAKPPPKTLSRPSKPAKAKIVKKADEIRIANAAAKASPAKKAKAKKSEEQTLVDESGQDLAVVINKKPLKPVAKAQGKKTPSPQPASAETPAQPPTAGGRTLRARKPINYAETGRSAAKRAAAADAESAEKPAKKAKTTAVAKKPVAKAKAKTNANSKSTPVRSAKPTGVSKTKKTVSQSSPDRKFSPVKDKAVAASKSVLTSKKSQDQQKEKEASKRVTFESSSSLSEASEGTAAQMANEDRKAQGPVERKMAAEAEEAFKNAPELTITEFDVKDGVFQKAKGVKGGGGARKGGEKKGGKEG